jgi:hypothetical protein
MIEFKKASDAFGALLGFFSITVGLALHMGTGGFLIGLGLTIVFMSIARPPGFFRQEKTGTLNSK